MDAAHLRRSMVERQIASRGITDPRVLDAMRTVPRELFVPDEDLEDVYGDHPLPIGRGQTISQPYVVALMAEAAEIGPTDRVLEVGTGSGYGAAVLAQLAGEVWTIERHRALSESAEEALRKSGANNVHPVHGDGTLGWADAAPYDAIIVTAAARRVPPALLDQLADGGRLVMPVGSSFAQELIRIVRRGDTLEEEELGGVRFVPLLPDTHDGGSDVPATGG